MKLSIPYYVPEIVVHAAFTKTMERKDPHPFNQQVHYQAREGETVITFKCFDTDDLHYFVNTPNSKRKYCLFPS